MMLPQYGSLSTSAQQQIAAQGATSDLNDSVTASNLQTLGTIRSNAQQREADIEALEAASHTLDPAQTDMATMQRMNQALLLQLRTQQEANQINQASATSAAWCETWYPDCHPQRRSKSNRIQPAQPSALPAIHGSRVVQTPYLLEHY